MSDAIAVECKECGEFVSAEAGEQAIAGNVFVRRWHKRHLWLDKKQYEVTGSSWVLHAGRDR